MRWIVSFCLICQTAFGSSAYISYSKSGGRFGDNLIAYLHAKWLSYQSGIPLLCQPFLYSTHLALDGKEIVFRPSEHFRLSKIQLRRGIKLNPDLPVLYECPYFPALEEEQQGGGWYSFPIDWKNPEFRAIALAMIAPKEELRLTVPPADVLSVAIHVREGGGFDTDHTRLYDPLKLPPLPFYIEALAKVLELFPDQKIYCHLFTDAVDTRAIGEALERSIPEGREVLFEYRAEKNHHTKNVLEDFYSLFHFDVLIRPRSNFSIVPSLLHDYVVVCFPAEYERIDTTIRITRIGVEKDEVLYNLARAR